MYITICEIDHQSKFVAWLSKPVYWDNPEGWDGEGGGGGGSGWGTRVHPWRFMSVYGKTHHNIVK